MARKLYKYQRDAVEKMKNGCILRGGVGSGKSRTALEYFVKKVCKGYSRSDGKMTLLKPKELYVITTAMKRDTLDWEREAAAFYMTTTDVSITPMHVDSWNNIGKYVDVKDAFFIFDEQRLVGKGAWAKAFLKIAEKNEWIVLSATPGDTWSDYVTIFLAHGFYRNRTEFNNEHCVFSRFTKYPMILRYINTRKLEHHLASILVAMESDKKTVRHMEWIKTDYDAELYKVVDVERWDYVDGDPIENASKWCYLCRRVVNEDQHRFEAVKNILMRHPRAIIFYNFNYELDLLKWNLENLEYPYSEWNGKKHEPIPDTDEWVYLVQYTAGAEGWNCITTNTVIFWSLNYSYKVMEQSCGRIDRVNTKYIDLYYYHLFSDAPIDKEIRNCIKKKKLFNEAAWADKEHF